MTTHAAAQARDLAAVSLLRAFLAEDRAAGMLIIEQNARTTTEAVQLLMAVTRLSQRALMSANGYDAAKAVAVTDQWMTTAARAVPS